MAGNEMVLDVDEVIDRLTVSPLGDTLYPVKLPQDRMHPRFNFTLTVLFFWGGWVVAYNQAAGTLPF